MPVSAGGVCGFQYSTNGANGGTVGQSTVRSVSGTRQDTAHLVVFCNGNILATDSTSETPTITASKYASGGVFNGTVLIGGTRQVSNGEWIGGGISNGLMAALDAIFVTYNTNVIAGGRV